jgi:hypothetical protein
MVLLEPVLIADLDRTLDPDEVVGTVDDVDSAHPLQQAVRPGVFVAANVLVVGEKMNPVDHTWVLRNRLVAD